MKCDNMTMKDIMFNIMLSLMKIEGHLSDINNKSDVIEMIGGDENDTTRNNQ